MNARTNQKQSFRLMVELLILLTTIAAALAIFLAIGAFRNPKQSHSVQLRVESSGGFAMITYTAGKDEVRQAKYVSVPWGKTVELSSGTEVYLTAANPSQVGKLTCSISLDRKPWKQQSAPGSAKPVVCGGIVP